MQLDEYVDANQEKNSSAKTTTEVWNAAIPVVSGLNTLESGHTGERRGRQELLRLV